MKFVDSHTHLTDINWECLKNMSMCGVGSIISPIHLPASRPVAKETIIDFWEYQSGKLLKKTERHFIKSYAMIGISMVGTPKDGIDELIDVLSEYLLKEEVVAIGEVGFEPGSGTCKDIDYQEDFFVRQVKLSKKMDVPINIHTPNIKGNKILYTKRSLEICKEYGLKKDNIIIDHCSKDNIEMVLDFGANAAITVQPFRNLSPKDGAELIKAYGSDKTMIDSDCGGSLASDALSVPKTVYEMRQLGIDEKDIEKVSSTNAMKVYRIEE